MHAVVCAFRLFPWPTDIKQIYAFDVLDKGWFAIKEIRE